jgi:hypothetical protein
VFVFGFIETMKIEVRAVGLWSPSVFARIKYTTFAIMPLLDGLYSFSV